jgi:hypothetical protein
MISARLLLRAVVLALCLAGCSNRSAAAGDDRQRFLVGPQPEHMKGRDHRFILEIPKSYLPRQFSSSSSTPLTAANVPFVARLEDFSGAGAGSALAPGVISGTISWAPDGFVRRSVDGSWLNSLSQYSVPLGKRFGLEARTVREAKYFPAELYVSISPDRDVMIECAYMVADRPQLCVMSSQSPNKPLIRISFDEKHLPQWKRIAAGVGGLLTRWTPIQGILHDD